MPVATGIVRRALVTAMGAVVHMPAESRGAATADCAKRFPLLKGHVVGVLERISVFEKNILNFWHRNHPVTVAGYLQGCQYEIRSC